MAVRLASANEAEARKGPNASVDGLGYGNNNRPRRRQGRCHSEAAHTTFIDTAFAVGPVGRCRRLIRGAAVAKHATVLRDGAGRDLRGAKACNEA